MIYVPISALKELFVRFSESFVSISCLNGKIYFYEHAATTFWHSLFNNTVKYTYSLSACKDTMLSLCSL
jgi:hypothetical protein